MSENELLQAIYHDVRELKSDVTELKKRVSSVELTLENETNRNIRIVAENHLDLSRKLDDALRVETEKEMLLIRMNVMENDIRRIKEKMAV